MAKTPSFQYRGPAQDISLDRSQGFPVAQQVKNLFATQKTLVRFLSQEDPLERGQATHLQYS